MKCKLLAASLPISWEVGHHEKSLKCKLVAVRFGKSRQVDRDENFSNAI